MPEHDELDERLTQRLRAYESRIPDGEIPMTDSRATRRARSPLAAGGVIAVGALAGVVLALVLLNRPADQIGESSPTPSQITSPEASPSTEAQSPAPTQASATPVASPTPLATAAPRTGWIGVAIDTDPGPERLDGVAEVRGRLFALGNASGVQPMIWFSDDAQSWTAATMPALPPDENGSLGGQMKALVDAGDRLVAIAALGFAGGSGYFGTAIYTSADFGSTWRLAESAPSITGTPMFDLVRQGSRVVAVGNGVWISDDAGLTWRETASGSDLGGRIASVSGSGQVLLGAGNAGSGDITSPPALAWLSRDGGLTWERAEIDGTAHATAALVHSSGRFLLAGYSIGPDQTGRAWISDDEGATWESAGGPFECCSADVVETGSGVVVWLNTTDADSMLSSSDLSSWATAETPVDSARSLSWGPTFGIVAAAETEIVLGPVPYP